jgi:hypothetical protein
MSFQIASFLVSKGDLALDAFVVQADPVTSNLESWDELRLTVWGQFEVMTVAELIATHFPLGTNLDTLGTLLDGYDVSTGKWFLQGHNLKCVDGPGTFEGELVFLGCADPDRPYKMSINSGVKQFDATNVTVTDGESTYGPWPKLRATEPEITIEVTYPVFGEAPATESVGKMVESINPLLFPAALEPPYTPDVREFYWIEHDDDAAIRQFPFGWWKESMPVECLAGVSPDVAHWARDIWRYTFELIPGNG